MHSTAIETQFCQHPSTFLFLGISSSRDVSLYQGVTNHGRVQAAVMTMIHGSRGTSLSAALSAFLSVRDESISRMIGLR